MTDLSAYIRAMRGPILVTGASGFIGANLFKTIAAVRPDVFACVRRQKGWRLDDVSNEQVVSVDLNDPAATKNMVDTLAPQTVFDCVAYGAYSFEQDSTLIYQTNYQSVVNLVSQLAGKPFSAFVHAGSSSEYGTNCAAPSETSQCHPNSHYSVSKAAISNYLQFMGKMHAFPCATLRLYSVYGPLEDTSRLIPNLLRKALAGSLPPFVAPDTSRDFIHVDDVCAAFVMTAAKMNPGIYGEPFNIGSGIKMTIRELADLTKRLFSIAVEPEFGSMEARSWDLSDWYANPTKARDLLGWTTQINPEAGLRSTARWVATMSDG